MTPTGAGLVSHEAPYPVLDSKATTKYVKCNLDAAAVEALPKPDGAPVYDDNAAAVEGHNFHDWLGRTLHGGWKREK
jgi:hypothetical protein